MTKPTRIIIPRDGIASGQSKPRAVYDPLSSKIMDKLGTTETVRASHVEPGHGLSQEALYILYEDGKATYEQDSFGNSLGYHIMSSYRNHWFADMTPTGHQVVLGPYDPDKRDVALVEEVKWLHEHNIPTCASCTEQSTTLGCTTPNQPQFHPITNVSQDVEPYHSKSYSEIARDGRFE